MILRWMRIVFPWCDSLTASNFQTEIRPSSVVWRLESHHMGRPTLILLGLLAELLASEEVHNIDSINITATVIDPAANKTDNRYRLG